MEEALNLAQVKRSPQDGPGVMCGVQQRSHSPRSVLQILHVYSETQNVILLENEVFVGVISLS